MKHGVVAKKLGWLADSMVNYELHFEANESQKQNQICILSGWFLYPDKGLRADQIMKIKRPKLDVVILK